MIDRSKLSWPVLAWVDASPDSRPAILHAAIILRHPASAEEVTALAAIGVDAEEGGMTAAGQLDLQGVAALSSLDVVVMVEPMPHVRPTKR